MVAQLLRSIEIIPANDTRIEAASPTTNYRNSDLALGFGINILIQIPRTTFLSSSYFESANLESVKLRLMPKSTFGDPGDTFDVYTYAINNVVFDLRNATWNTYNGTNSWTTPGGLDNKDSSSESRVSKTHYVGTAIELDITEPIKSNLDKGNNVQLILTGVGSDTWFYHDVGAASESDRPLLTVNYKSYQDSWRLGSTSAPSMPNL